MNAPRIHRHLSLESLETRTLLAGADDLFGLKADFQQAQTALTGMGDYSASFSTNWGNRQLVITGSATSSLTIDLDRLPDFITNLKISSFSSVTLLGSDDVDNLILRDIGSVSGAGLDVNVSVHATNVGALTLASAGKNALLEGTTMDLAVRSLENTMLFTNFDTLTLSSESDSLFIITENASQTLKLTYRPDDLQLVGMPSTSLKIVLPGSTTTPPPVIDAGTGSGSSGGGTVTNPQPDTGSGPITEVPANPTQPDEVIVVNFGPDDRMRSFIAELRSFLKASVEDPRQGTIDALNNFAGLSNPTLLVIGQQGQLARALPDAVNTVDLLADIHLVAALEGATEPVLTPTQLELNTDTWGSAGNRLIVPDAELPQNLIGVPLVEATPSEVGLNRPALVDSPAFAMPKSEERQADSKMAEMVDNVRAFGGYLVERVSSELTPGQQSLVLLVDPKPTRGGMINRNSALDLFARGGVEDTSISIV